MDTPLYGNGSGINFTSDKSLNNNDSCNTMNLTFPNHSGTHIDFPFHFNKKGKKLNDYPASFWEFKNVGVLDLSSEVEDSQIIQPELLNKKLDPSTDLILIRTGYEKFRGTNRYTLTPPGLSSKTAEFLRTHYLSLDA